MEENKIIKEKRKEAIDKMNEKSKKIYTKYCWKCIDENQLPTPMEIKKDKELYKECKDILKENKGKYKDERCLKREIRNVCPKCGASVFVVCKDYIDFYKPKKKEIKKEEKVEE